MKKQTLASQFSLKAAIEQEEILQMQRRVIKYKALARAIIKPE